MKIKICDLKLGDVVQLSEGAYMCATVQQVTADEVILFRPYVHCADFSYTGGVITYIGTETVKYCAREFFQWLKSRNAQMSMPLDSGTSFAAEAARSVKPLNEKSP